MQHHGELIQHQGGADAEHHARDLTPDPVLAGAQGEHPAEQQHDQARDDVVDVRPAGGHVAEGSLCRPGSFA
ncbi:MAG: hypothetical protein V9G10_00220 [Candidatus Nanopelagicales bacterium]